MARGESHYYDFIGLPVFSTADLAQAQLPVTTWTRGDIEGKMLNGTTPTASLQQGDLADEKSLISHHTPAFML